MFCYHHPIGFFAGRFPDNLSNIGEHAWCLRRSRDTRNSSQTCILWAWKWFFWALRFWFHKVHLPVHLCLNPLFSNVYQLISSPGCNWIIFRNNHDIRHSLNTNPLTSFSHLETVIEDLAFIYSNSGVSLAIVAGDGLPYLVSVIPEGPSVNGELAGADCDPVRISREEIIIVGGKCGVLAMVDVCMRRAS